MKSSRILSLGTLAATLLIFCFFNWNMMPPASAGHIIQRQSHPTGLRFAPEPANGAGAAAVNAELDRIRQSALHIYKGSAADLDSLQVMPPIALHRLDIDGLASGRMLKPTQKAECYLYLIKASGNNIATVWVSVDDSGKAEVGSIDYGLGLAITGIAHEKLPILEEVRAGSYEVRFLLDFDAYFTALWLKSDPGGNDLIYPVGFGEYNEKFFTVPEFLAEFGPMVKKTLDDRRQAWAGSAP